MSYINEYANPLLDLFNSQYASSGRIPTLADIQLFFDQQLSSNPDALKRLRPDGTIASAAPDIKLLYDGKIGAVFNSKRRSGFRPTPCFPKP